MSIEIKYAGTQQRWPELSITGKQSVWMPGQIEERDDVEAVQLLATGLFKSEPIPLTATLSAQGGRFGSFGLPEIYPLYQTVDGLGVVEYRPTILAALVASSTASQSGNIVTVICGGASPAAHNIAASEEGSRIYYPGSPSIPAGLYQGFSRIDANTFSFTRSAAATVASESVNAGAAFVSAQTIASAVIPGGSIGANGRLTLCGLRGGFTLSAFVRLVLGGTILHGAPTTSSSFGEVRQTIRNRGSESIQACAPGLDGVLSATALTPGAVNTAVDQTLAMTWQAGAAGSAIWMPSAEIEIVHK